MKPVAIKRPFAPPKFVQRLTMHGEDFDNRFLENHRFQVMGNVEFEGGNPSRAIRHLGEVGKIASISPHGYQTLVIYDPAIHDRESLVLMLTALWDGSFVPTERIDFNKHNTERKKLYRGEGYEVPNAWLDIVNNVYWTMVDVNIADVQKTMRIQANYWDAQRKIRQGKAKQQLNAVERALRRGSESDLRSQLILSGRLKPR